MMPIEFTIKPRTIGLILGLVALYLSVQSIFGEYIQATLLSQKLDSVPAQIFDDFSVNAEGTIPNWYSASILLAAAALLALIALAKRSAKAPYAAYWIALALIFVYLSADEGAAIHEIFAEPLHVAYKTGGFLSFGWQALAAPLLILFGVLYLRFLFHLPARIRNLFILSGVIYVGGAFFGDAVQANQFALGGDKVTLTYLTIGTIEEFLEMLGMAVFIYTLLSYIVEMQYAFTFRAPALSLKAVPPSLSSRDLVAAHETSTIAERSSASASTRERRRTLRRLASLVVALVLTLNLGVLYWGMTQPPSSPSVTNASPSAYDAIIAKFPTDNLLVTRMSGTFSVDNLPARQFAASLLSMFDNVMVITLPADQSSLFIAGRVLPFDDAHLLELLEANGASPFVVYDTPAVQIIVGKVQPVAGK